MRLNRFFAKYITKDGIAVVADDDFVNQVRNVLRMVSGDKLVLCDGMNGEAVAKIISFNRNEVLLEILENTDNNSEPTRVVTLYCSVLKKENFELVAQKAVEVGVTKIVPIISSRTVKTNINPDRINKIIKEAAEQSGRGILPELAEAVSLKVAFGLSANNEKNILFDISGNKFETINIGDRQGVGLFIGPEGGWDAQELEQARVTGLDIVSLGGLTLRAETAAIVSCYLVVNS